MADEKLRDEADVLEENITLTGQVKTLTTERDTSRTQLATLTSERDTATAQTQAITKERDDARTQVTALTGERDQVQVNLAATEKERDTLKAENAKLTTAMADFDKRVAAELAKRGIRKEGAAQAALGAEVKPRSFKERLAEARS